MSRAYIYAAVLAALVLAVPLASGAASDLPPTPTIDSAPPNPSATGSATLSFSDADPLVTFMCQIDGSAFSLCTSPATYSGLADGSHTFGVKAVDVLLNESDVASYTWSVDTAPPHVPTITAKPSNPSNDSSPAFQFTDTEGGVSFRCKLDSGGFAACVSPATYSGQADGSHTFTVEAADAAGNTSSTTYSWAIDTVVPTITLGTKPPSPSSDATPTFAFSANEATPGGFECKLDNGAFAACTSPTTLGSTPDGSHTYTVRATDTAGNTGQASYTWTIDTVAPTVTLGSKPPNPSNDPTPTLAFSADEAVPGGFECKLDNGTFAACTSPTTLGPTPDGSHTFTVRATDTVGNTGQASYTWTIDTVAPTVTLGTKPPNPSNDSTPTFSFSASEASAFQCQLDAGAFAPCTSPTTLGSIADGSHTYTVKATDAAGNTSQASYTWTIDTVAPTVTLGTKPPNPSNDSTPSFSFSAGETSTFQCQLDAGAFAPCTSPTTLGSTADGSHIYSVKGTDAAGNTGPVASYVWTIDTVAPTVTLTAKPSNPSNDSTPTFSFSASETSAFQCQLDAGAFAPCTSPTTLGSTADGSHTYTVKATDAAGNTGPVTSYVWTIDTVAPTVTFSIKPPNPTNDTTPDFAFSASETVPAGFQCQLDAAAFAACTSPKALPATADGSHTFTVKAIDAAGNTGQASYTWTIDTAAPQITLGTKPTNPSNDTTPDFAFSANETLLGGFQCQLDGAAFAACTSPKTLPATADGSHTFTVKAIDTAGNPGQTSYTWTIDTAPPTITLTQTPPNFSSNSTPTFAFTADEPISAGFQCKLDAGAFAACTSPKTFGTTPDGSHTFTVKGADAAGNNGSTSYAWTIDTVAPVLSLTAKPPDPSGVSTAHFEFSATDQTSVAYQCQLDAGAFQSCTSPKDFSGLPNGPHSFTARGTDAAGNTGSASYSWSVDTAVPVVTINQGPLNPTNLTGATFAFTSSKPSSTFECQLDGGGFSACTSPKTYASLLAGSHSFQARATDSLGHTGPPTTYSWTIDLTPPPTPSISSTPANPSNSSSPSFVFTDTEPATTFQCQLDGGAFAACASPKAYSGLADGPHSFNVKAIDPAGNQSGPAGYTWTIDTVAPTITLGTKPVDPTNDNTPDFAFSANETVPAGFQCKLDAGAFAACTSPKTLPATGDGLHTFTVKANDAAGNTGQAIYTWTIDTVAPTITLGTKPVDPTNDNTPDFAFNANETISGGFQCKLDAGAFAACTSPKTLPATADGSHTFTVKANDTAGNTGQVIYTWTIDTDPPTITLAAPPPNPSNDATPTFTFSADEPTPGGFQCKLDAGAFAACTSPKTFGTTPDGSHTFTVKGADAAGNNGSTSYTWTIDTSAPVLTLTQTPANPSGVATAHFEFSATDQASVSFQCQLDGGSFLPCATPPGQDYSSLTSAAHTFTLKGTDAAGNSIMKPFTWTVDTVNPVVTITAGPPNPSNQATPTFTFTSNKSPSTFECQLDAGAFAPCASPRTLGATPEGSHTFKVRATDSLNHTGGPTAFSWTIDTTAPPAPAIGSGPATPTNLTNASFVFSDSEPGLSFQCQRDGGVFSACTSPASYSGLPDGAHTFAVRATDAAGNAGVTASKGWTVDTVPPDTTIGSTPPAVSSSGSANFGFASTEPGSTFACSLDGGTFASCSSPQSYAGLSNGAHAFQVKATDAAGNSDATAAAYSWQIQVFAPVDRTPPGNVRGLKRSVGYGLLEMAWGLPPDVDFDHVRVLLSTSPKKPARKVVYTGKGKRYMNRSFKNGTYYRYSIVSYDHAGNASHGVTVVVAASALLRSPRDGSVVHSAPLFLWRAIKGASFYNVQVYDGSRKVLSRWPRTARLRLGRAWTYEGQDFQLKKGTYHWYVWPGFGPRLKGHYGQLLGESTFRVG